MTNVYFVRHAQSDHRVRDDLTRPLTEKGLQDRQLATQYLADKGLSVLLSSPCKRAYDTVADFSAQSRLPISCVAAFKERRAGSWVDDFDTFARKQWADFDYKLSGGESLREVQTRNIQALRAVLAAHPDKAIAIGTHGMALSSIINYFDPAFGYECFMEILNLMPWIVHFEFDGDTCTAIHSIDLFSIY